MKKTLTAIAATALMSLAGVVSAAEPMQLDDSQMDNVSAAGMSSFSITAGRVLIGTVASGSETAAYTRITPWSRTYQTTASSATIATGVGVVAGSAAGSRL